MFEGIDGVFFITIATLSCGFFGLVIRYCLKSKCENISCCYGLISVKRNVELESQEEMREMASVGQGWSSLTGIFVKLDILVSN
jgi:hypothetical protein